MSVLNVVGPKSTLAASHAAPRWVCQRDRQTDRRTLDRYITPSARRSQRNKQKFIKDTAPKYSVSNRTAHIWYEVVSCTLVREAVASETIYTSGSLVGKSFWVLPPPATLHDGPSINLCRCGSLLGFYTVELVQIHDISCRYCDIVWNACVTL